MVNNSSLTYMHKKSGIQSIVIPLPWPSNLPQTEDNNDEARTIQLPNFSAWLIF